MSKDTRPQFYRQGDVIILRVSEEEFDTSGLTAVPEGEPVILAHGEVTGHCHRADDVTKLKGYATSADPDAECTLLEVAEALAIVHEEHAPITLPPGRYRSIIQKESRYDWEEARRVRD